MKASETFRHPDYKHNCAQAVAYKWRALAPQTDLVAEMQGNGTGHAIGGKCGALVCATTLLPQHKAEIEAEFEQRAGSRICRELKTVHKTPCTACIDIADELVAKYSATDK